MSLKELRDRKPLLIIPGAILFYFAMAGMFILALPKPHEQLQFMVAGAFATAMSLLAVFVLYAFGRLMPAAIARTVRRTEQSS